MVTTVSRHVRGGLCSGHPRESFERHGADSGCGSTWDSWLGDLLEAQHRVELVRPAVA